MCRPSASLVVCAAVLYLGCGGESESGSGSEGGSSGQAGEAGGSGVGGSAGTGGMGAQGGTPTGGNAGTNAGSGGASGAAGSGGSSGEEPLVPLISGHRSNFRFVALDSSMPMLETCDDPFTEVGEMDTIEGVTGTRYLSFCTDTIVLLEGSGDSLTAHIIDPTGTSLGAELEHIHSPVVEGESWQTSAGEYTWAEVTEPLAVPGGTFDDCWERVASAGLATFTYCRGVGLVAGVFVSNNWQLELISKNF